MSNSQITPELVTAVLRVASNAYECYRDIARRRGMTEGEILVAWRVALETNENADLAKYVAELGGEFTPEPSQE